MQKMIDELYKKKKLDKITPVTQYEYKQREIRTRLDIADIYNRLIEVYAALEEKGIEINTGGAENDTLVSMVKEDLLSTEIDFAEKKYQERVEAYENGSIIEYIRRLFSGQPLVPLFDAEEDVLKRSKPKVSKKVNQKRQAKIEVDTKNEEEDRILEILKSVEKRGGVAKATPDEKEELKTVLTEIKTILKDKEEIVVVDA